MMTALRTLLQIEGFAVDVTPDITSMDAIMQVVREGKPDVLLLDVHLRQNNGFEILARLREDNEIAGTYVVMSSGMDIKDRCLAAGADDFLLKPYMPDELLQKIRR
jgi:DNA-binding response OmpR family regulator